jgi:hypothetical protein
VSSSYFHGLTTLTSDSGSSTHNTQVISTAICSSSQTSNITIQPIAYCRPGCEGEAPVYQSSQILFLGFKDSGCYLDITSCQICYNHSILFSQYASLPFHHASISPCFLFTYFSFTLLFPHVLLSLTYLTMLRTNLPFLYYHPWSMLASFTYLRL